MTVINNMEVTDELVDFLKRMAPYKVGFESLLDSKVEDLSQLNDWFLDALTAVPTDNVTEMREISNYLINIKCIKDDLKNLNKLLKKCKIERGDEEC